MTSSPEPASTSKTKLSDIVFVVVILSLVFVFVVVVAVVVVVLVFVFVLLSHSLIQSVWPTLADADGDDRKLDSHCEMGRKRDNSASK